MTSRPADGVLHAARERLRTNLAAFTRLEPVEGSGRRAAVAIVVTSDDVGQPAVVLTKRSASIRRHRGQWALPGGRLDPDESVEQAALRELHEELGLSLEPAALLGHLDDYPTRSGFRIAPVVVWAGPDATLTPDPAEVAFAIRVPLTELDRPDSPRWDEVDDAAGPVIQLPIGERLIHAPTAAILYQFREVAMHGRDTRVAHFDEPHFARR